MPCRPSPRRTGPAVISNAESKNPGTAHLEFDAPHATSFNVFQRVSSDANFTQVVDDGIEHTYDATGLKKDINSDFKVVPRNSLGEGPEAKSPLSR
ncbi:MAG TPA: hypothetical protein VK581_13970 [Chthoniobacterales bacterium]|nr:hypothetical protein [Chthoniobacterales bacterium]